MHWNLPGHQTVSSTHCQGNYLKLLKQKKKKFQSPHNFHWFAFCIRETSIPSVLSSLQQRTKKFSPDHWFQLDFSMPFQYHPMLIVLKLDKKKCYQIREVQMLYT